MANVTHPLWIYVATRGQYVNAALHVDNFLEKLRRITFIDWVLDWHVSRTRHGIIWQERDQSALGQCYGLLKKFFAIAHGRVLPAPVSPNNRRERASALQHDQISRDDSAFGTIVSDVVNSCVRAMLHSDLLEVERRVSIVIEVAGEISFLSRSGHTRSKQ